MLQFYESAVLDAGNALKHQASAHAHTMYGMPATHAAHGMARRGAHAHV